MDYDDEVLYCYEIQVASGFCDIFHGPVNVKFSVIILLKHSQFILIRSRS
jgi:hypothetical protein